MLPVLRKAIALSGLTIVLAAFACQGSGRPTLLVFAAASLTDSLTEVGRAFESQGDTDVSFSYGASQLLAQQIVKGAPADVFIPAGEFPVEFLEEEGLIGSGPVSLLSNKLVLVTRPDIGQLESIEDLRTDLVGRLAVADPDLAPAGTYARESLMRLGLWEQLRRKLLIGTDVRATLSYVETGNADAAIVYRTDAATAEGVQILDLVPQDSYSDIVYPALVVSETDHRTQADRFLEFLSSEVASAIFARYGFEPVAGDR